MKKILLTIILIFLPNYVASSSFDDIKGYWLSEDDWPLLGHKVTLIITDNTLRHRKMKPMKFSIKNSDCGYIIKYDDNKQFGEKSYNKMYDKIIIVNKNKIIREVPTGDSKRKQWIYNRITEEEVQKYLDAPLNHGLNLNPVDDPVF